MWIQNRPDNSLRILWIESMPVRFWPYYQRSNSNTASTAR